MWHMPNCGVPLFIYFFNFCYEKYCAHSKKKVYVHHFEVDLLNKTIITACLSFMVKYFKTQAQGRFFSVFNTNIEADQNVNALFTGSKSVKRSMYSLL